MADSVTFKKGAFKVKYRPPDSAKFIDKEVTGTVASNGLAIHKDGPGYLPYTIYQKSSGILVDRARTLGEAKEKIQRYSGVTNWHKKVKPTAALKRKFDAAKEGKPIPSGRRLDKYDIKARYRKPPAHVVEEKKAEGYKDQRQKRGQIRRDLHSRHIGYTTEVYNESRQYYLKRPKGK